MTDGKGRKTARTALVGAVLLLWPALHLTSAQAAGCATFFADTNHVLRGMVAESSGRRDDVFLFPLFADRERLAYVTCPDIGSVRPGSPEKTFCRFGVVELEAASRKGRLVDLPGCTRNSPWAPGLCPDFTADGFSEGNGRNLADALKRNRAWLCKAMPGGATILRLEPAKTPEGHFEVGDGCGIRDLPEPLRRSCDRMAAARKPVLGVSWMKAGGHTIGCLVGRDWTLLACSRR